MSNATSSLSYVNLGLWGAWSALYCGLLYLGRFTRIPGCVALAGLTIALAIYGHRIRKEYRAAQDKAKRDAVASAAEIPDSSKEAGEPVGAADLAGEQGAQPTDVPQPELGGVAATPETLFAQRCCVLTLFAGTLASYWLWMLFGQMSGAFWFFFPLFAEPMHLWIAAALTRPYEGRRIDKAYFRLLLKFAFEFLFFSLVLDRNHPMGSIWYMAAMVELYALAVYIFKLQKLVVKAKIMLWRGVGHFERDEKGEKVKDRNTFGL